MAARIRTHDWAATPLGPIGQWPERLKLMVEQVLANPLVASLVCGSERVLIYNDAAARLYRDRHPAAVGRPLPEAFPDGWSTVAPFYGRAFEGEAVRVVEQPLDTRGEKAATDVFDALLTPVREMDGQVAYVHMMGFEIGERLRAEAALRTSEAEYRYLFDALDEGFCTVEVLFDAGGQAIDYRFLSVNATFEQQTGLHDVVGRTIREMVPKHEAHWFEIYGRIVRTGQSERFEERADALGRLYDVFACRVGGAEQRRVAILFKDILARRRREEARRSNEERQAFLLKLTDALRLLSDPAAIQGAACRLLGTQLDVERAYYVEIDEREGVAIVSQDYVADGAFSLAGEHPIANFAWSVDILRRGDCHVVADTQKSTVVPVADRAALSALRIVACMGAPLVKADELVGALCVTNSSPRTWSAAEVELLREVGERIWSAVERAKSDAARRESEQRFTQFANASAAALWIKCADTLNMEYVSPAMTRIYGVEAEALLGDVERWAALIVPEDRDLTLSHLERVRQGEAMMHEYRIRRPADGEERWIRNTDFPLHNEAGRVQRIGGIAEDVTEAKRTTRRLEVLVNELQHRARNLLGVVTAVADRTLKQGGSVDAFQLRLQALSRAQGLLSQGGSDTVAVGTLVRAELAAHVDQGAKRVSITGAKVMLTVQQVQNFALALHELTTNAVKYGALANDSGRLAVAWEVVLDRRGRRRLALSWIESGVVTEPDRSVRRGYGTELIKEALAYALQAKVDYQLGPDGVRCRIEMPVS